MKAVSKIMTGAVGIAALVGMAAPAAAQYPGYYPGYNTGGNVIGQVLSTILNPYGAQQRQYGYGINPQAAVQQCSAAVQSRLARSSNAGYGYNPYGGYNAYGYNGGYSNAYSNARVLQVTRVEPRSSTTMRVRGLASSGTAAAYSPYGNYGGYGGYGAYGGYNTAAAADLTFKCDVDYRGYIRDIDIDRRY